MFFLAGGDLLMAKWESCCPVGVTSTTIEKAGPRLEACFLHRIRMGQGRGIWARLNCTAGTAAKQPRLHRARLAAASRKILYVN